MKLPSFFRRRDARQNQDGEEAAEDADNEGSNDDAGANRERRSEEEEQEDQEGAITVRVTQDAETGRRTFNIRDLSFRVALTSKSSNHQLPLQDGPSGRGPGLG